MNFLSISAVLFCSAVISSVYPASISNPEWVSWKSKWSGIPDLAVVGGKDEDGNDLYIIKAQTQYGVLPGKFNKFKSNGYVSYGENEIAVQSFQVEH